MGRRRKNILIRLKPAIISNYLAKLNINIKDLSQRTDISYKYLCDLLSGNPRSIPTEAKVGKIATALGAEPWQIADGMEPPHSLIREAQALYSNNFGSSNGCQMAMIKAQKAGLNEEELRKMGAIIAKIADLLTTEDRQERERYATVIYGMIALCQPALSQQGGRENGESSYLLEREK